MYVLVSRLRLSVTLETQGNAEHVLDLFGSGLFVATEHVSTGHMGESELVHLHLILRSLVDHIQA